jgi:uncharacterized protein YndB with AHSA1/START domain
VTQPQFAYVTYVAASPERLWGALTDPVSLREPYGLRIEGEWRRGGALRFLREDGSLESEGTLVELDPPRRLSFTWRSAVVGGRARAVPRAVAGCLLERMGPVVRLTVTETHEEPVDEEFLEGGRRGWPLILSRLKTLLETGRAMPRPARP